MNIFVLDLDPSLAAEYHCNKHAVKMILEHSQLLSTAHRVLDQIDKHPMLYRATHKNHPCGVWARKSDANYRWLFSLLESCHFEYALRYGRAHASARLLPTLSVLPSGIAQGSLTDFAQAMPDHCKVPGDPVAAYRRYYLTEKQHILQWKHIRPHWV